MKMRSLKSHREHISLLMSYQFLTLKNTYLISVCAMVLLPIIGLLIEKNSLTERYSYINTFMSRPLCWTPYVIILIFWIVYYIYRALQRKWKYCVDDRMMILPCSRSDVILADVLTIIGIYFSFYIVQAFTYTLGYIIFINQYPSLNIANGYFLSILQTAYTKFFMPINWSDMILLYVLTAWFALIIVYFTHFGKYLKKGILAHISAFGFLIIIGLFFSSIVLVPYFDKFVYIYSWVIKFFTHNIYLIYIVLATCIIANTIHRFLRKQYL